MTPLTGSLHRVSWSSGWPVSSATERHGWVVRIRDDRGHIAHGEAAPLPGRSRDDLDEAEIALGLALGRLESLDLDAPPLLEAARINPHPHVISAQWALDVALLDLIGQRRNVSAVELLGGKADATCGIAHLVAGDDAAQLTLVAQTVAGRGAAALKVKLGRGPVDNDLEAMSVLRSAVGPDIELRADANRAWDLASANRALEVAEGLSFAFVEEPCQDPLLLPQLASHRWAADESTADLMSMDLARLLAAKPAAIVLKPALLGMACTRELAATIGGLAIPIVISHADDGAIGHAGALACALAIGHKHAAGLGWHPGLDRWSAQVPGLFHPRGEIVGPGLGFAPGTLVDTEPSG